MEFSSKIVFKTLEAKNLASMISCIGQTETQKNTFLEVMGYERQPLEKIFYDFLQEENEEIYKKIIIAVDELANDKVVACIVGEDLHEVVEEMQHAAEDPVMETYHCIQREILKPLIEEKHAYGQYVIIDSFGVLPEYQALKIGQMIFLEYAKHLQSLGYIAFTGLCYNRVTVHICKKYGSTRGHMLTLENLQEICPDIKDKFRNSVELPYMILADMQRDIASLPEMLGKIEAVSMLSGSTKNKVLEAE